MFVGLPGFLSWSTRFSSPLACRLLVLSSIHAAVPRCCLAEPGLCVARCFHCLVALLVMFGNPARHGRRFWQSGYSYSSAGIKAEASVSELKLSTGGQLIFCKRRLEFKS